MTALYLLLFWVFFKIGLFSFGGGLAMVSVIQQEVLAHNWIDATEYARIITISQMTPGPIAINTATYVGARVCGPDLTSAFIGSLIATLGVSSPSFVIVYFVARSLEKFSSSTIVKYALNGIRPAVIAFMISAVVFFLKLTFFPDSAEVQLISFDDFNIYSLPVLALLFYLHKYRGIGAISLMLIAGCLGCLM